MPNCFYTKKHELAGGFLSRKGIVVWSLRSRWRKGGIIKTKFGFQKHLKSCQDQQLICYNALLQKSGKSKIKAIALWFNSGGYIQVTCTDWSDKIEKEKYFKAELKVSIADEEFYNFLINEAYE